MKSLRSIFRYISKYPKLIFAYFSFNILSSLLSVISLALLSPFLLLIFKDTGTLHADSNPGSFLARMNPVNKFKAELYDIIQSPNGDVKALAVICIVILVAIILKNVFLYSITAFGGPQAHVAMSFVLTSLFL